MAIFFRSWLGWWYQSQLWSLWSETSINLEPAKMAPPPPNECPVDGCPYKTPATLPNYDLVYRDLDIHTKYSHINLIPAKAPRHTGEASAAKADKLPRPELKEGATEADYIYFKDSWTGYKHSTGLSGQAAVDQLWACCSSELSRSVYDSGVTSQDDENN